ncbi:ATP-binding cassette domain-containing protein [Neolewinella antarctica]|uniref:ABC-type nitrate/sulfonate/bicarbonate transport system ATPase subunit n=1 Tax=Neolewinella antarctica TaxID=442734 RepID=A0ABX0X937_9BACT|nr:ATP-binding cassette domain-containing protein [Neolewinella antarctica]NJC25779.1 ABC-type nitrate/sulfonate/bicarbonate transport system ATPase subunit [Neolewinella antarctica]
MPTYNQAEAILQVQDVGVAYGDKQIIQNINFTEKDVLRPDQVQGQTIAFVGRSGRGKSTLFRSLAGLEKPTQGTILISDLDAQEQEGHPPLRGVREGDVGFVSQNYVLFRHKTIEQAMEFAMRKREDVSETEKGKMITQHLKDWGLYQVKDQYPNELSGGQRQRTAILEQVLSSTNYIIMDEPFSGLDVGNIQNVINAFKLINLSHELATIIFCTHDIELAVELADSLYVIGYPTKPGGGLDNVGTLVKHFDLKARGIAWSDQFSREHQLLVEEVKQAILDS